MSTTSCPRCSAQVTLPVGVSNDATVRCPLCHAHYTLADALVNMPPLLEVVESESEALAADWLDERPAAGFESQNDTPIATALPIDDMDEEASEAETLELGSLELGSLELDDEPKGDIGQETLAEDLGFSTIESPAAAQEPKAALPVDDDDALGDDDILGELGGDDLSAGEAEEEELPLDFGEELSAEAAGAETMEFSSESLAGFSESDAGELKFDLESDEARDETNLGATLDFGATLEDNARLDEPSDEGEAGELAFDSFDAEGETVQFEPQEVRFGGEEEVKFDDPLASGGAEETELREFEDLRFEPSDEAADAPEAVPVVPVMAVTPVEAVEEPQGKKGKKEKKKKEKKAKVKAEGGGDKRKRSLVGILLGILIAIPAALYGLLWLGKDYDVGLSAFLPAAVLPAEYSKKAVVAQNYVPPAALPPSTDSAPAADEPTADAATETPAEEVPAEATAPAEELPTDDESTAHTTARPATDDPAAAEAIPADNSADEAPSLAEPTDAAPAEEMPADAAAEAAAPAEDDLFAPATDTPASEPAADTPAAAPAESDPFAPAAETPAETTAPAADAAADPFAPAADAPAAEPAAEAPAESDPFAPAADAPAEQAAEPAGDLFAPAAETPEPATPAAAMPAEKAPAAPAEDDLFAPATDAPAAEPAAAEPSAPAETDPFAPAAAPAAAETPAEAPAEAPAEMPAENDPFAPAAEAAAEPAAPPAETTRPAEPDPFAPEPVTPAEEMPAAEDPVDPLTDKPAAVEEDVLTPAPATAPEEMPEARPAAEDPLSLPAAPAAPELPADAPAEPVLPAPAATPDRVGPRNVQPVSPAELTGAMQAAFVANQQLIAAEAAADEAQLRKARAAFYVNLFGMADAITAAQQGAGAAELDPQLQQLGTILKQQLAADPRRLESLKVFGARWIGFPKRTTDGVVVSGTVESAEQVGQLFHTKARLGSGAEAPLVTIISATDPQLANGDTVVALGSIVERPAEQIAGYQGSEPSVMWSGMSMKVPAN